MEFGNPHIDLFLCFPAQMLGSKHIICHELRILDAGRGGRKAC